MALHKSLLELVQSKDSALRESEVSRNAAFSELESCENEKALLSARVHELEEKLREIQEAESERVQEEGKLLERVESLTCELQAEKAKRNRVTEAYKRLKSQHVYLRRKFGLAEENVAHHKKSESGSEFGTHQSPIVEPGLEMEIPDVFVSAHDINEVKKTSEDDRGVNLSSSSGFRDVPKCPSSTKLVPVSSTKRPASSWRHTRSHQSRVGPDPHDDFLDTPLENIRGNLNKDLNKEDLLPLVQKDISLDDSDDETQDVNAKSSPQKKQKQSSNEDDETQDMNVKSSPQKKQKQSSITVTNKRNFKYVEPVRKKAERENLKGVECKQCRKFYDAVLPNADGKDADSSKQNFRCEHLDGASRHRYRYVPPMTPEGFWNIGFESEM
uniref:Protein gamma response 1 n=1 Tax=Cajanus cajan TaxID=3821 RepID=A0A151TSD8_CAJCA|nr:Protein gamma response 1 [Cajanus cajan]